MVTHSRWDDRSHFEPQTKPTGTDWPRRDDGYEFVLSRYIADRTRYPVKLEEGALGTKLLVSAASTRTEQDQLRIEWTVEGIPLRWTHSRSGAVLECPCDEATLKSVGGAAFLRNLFNFVEEFGRPEKYELQWLRIQWPSDSSKNESWTCQPPVPARLLPSWNERFDWEIHDGRFRLWMYFPPGTRRWEEDSDWPRPMSFSKQPLNGNLFATELDNAAEWFSAEFRAKIKKIR